jgi:hypothetical protein
MIYRTRIDNKAAFTNNVFTKFTNAVGGNPKEFADILYGRLTTLLFSTILKNLLFHTKYMCIKQDLK